MRKLTGYIGAMIIVFALAGSILAGFALNINGTTAVINEYEKVTDISGLYEHTDEKQYIEYNPASNYTAYSGQMRYKNTPASDYLTARQFYGGNTFRFHNQKIYVNGVEQNPITSGTSSAKCVLFADNTYIVKSPNQNYFNWVIPGQQIYTDNITVAQDATTGALTITGYDTDNQPFGVVYPNQNLVVYYTGTDTTRYDYYYNRGTDLTGDLSAYFSAVRPIYTVGAYTNSTFTSVNYDLWYINTQTSDETELFTTQYYAPSVYYSPDINYNDTPSYVMYHVFYPRAMYSSYGSTLGIEYTESSRVNNYLMESTNPATTTSTSTLTLNQVGDNNYFYYNTQGNKQMNDGTTMYMSIKDVTGSIIIPIQYPTLTMSLPALKQNGNSYEFNYDGFHNVKLSTVLQSYNVPAGTTSIKISTESNSIYNFNNGLVTANLDKNLVYFSYLPNMIKDGGFVPSLNSEINKKDYLIYDIGNNIATVYTYNGITRYSGSPDDIGIFYYEDNTTSVTRYTYGTGQNTATFFDNITDRPTPYITIESTQAVPGTQKYADITKGYAINPSAYSVTWNNAYENGDIKIVFRADETTGSYSNELTISNNVIKVKYENKHFYVKLRPNEYVDIGTWRNIVLDVDLINNKLYVEPVRTFNSFTNVTLDSSKILIGDLSGNGPTNVIVWSATTNSLLFNVYSTDVFMNTYGVVMVNPYLDITDYFTDLNLFYRLKMFNFATYGDSMTINGRVLTVTNGTVTYDDTTLELRDLNVTYADGKVTIGDNHGTIDLGNITTSEISMSGAWYFLTELERGYTSQKLIYDWDWGTFIFDNTQFCVFYIGFMAAALIVARKYCSFSIMDYAVLVISIVIALGVQVIA